MSAPLRLPCTCTPAHQPCDACVRWAERRRPLRGRARQAVAPAAELRLRGLAHHYAPAATTPLLVPLTPWEVRWISL
jgi:hypothetical protein